VIPVRCCRSLVLAVAMVALPAAVAAAQPVATFQLPAPTGRLPVGTTRWVVQDQSRPETFAAGKTRQVEVVAWYPAVASKAATAPYVRSGMAEVLSFARLAQLGNAFDGLAHVTTHAVVDADPAALPMRFPVILFQHGYAGLPSAHTALAEDLASHGWCVLSVIHPYEATGARLADGTVITFLDDQGALRRPIADVFAEWDPEDATMTAIAAAASEAEQEALMRGYLATLKNTHLVVTRWVLDTKAVLDRLPSEGAAGRLAARLDLARIGAAGHSMGGVASGQFCVEDRRCKAGLNLDGIPQYGTMIDRKMPVPFLMVYSGRRGRAGANDLIYRRAASSYVRVDVAGTQHLDFSDMNFWGGPLRQRGAYGAIAPARAAEVTRTIVREFFGQEILGQASRLLSGQAKWADVAVVELRNP